MKNIDGKKILLIICGGISAYKSLEIIRLLKKRRVTVKTILTKNAKEFVTPLSVASLSKKKFTMIYLMLKMKQRWIIYRFHDGLI